MLPRANHPEVPPGDTFDFLVGLERIAARPELGDLTVERGRLTLQCGQAVTFRNELLRGIHG
jgi:hypothetical protein